MDYNSDASIGDSYYSSEQSGRFQDEKLSVDFVLAYNSNDTAIDKKLKRNVFEENLEKEGLKLELDRSDDIYFVKIHVPLDVLYTYSEILKIKLPMKRQSYVTQPRYKLLEIINSLFSWCCCSVELDTTKFPPQEQRIFCEYSRNYNNLFDWESPNFFSANVKSAIINFILERQHFVKEKESPDNLGIEKLIADGVYDSAYPLHDEGQKELLLNEWATLRKWLRYQPLDYVREYFGPKVALYYAWLGFYTMMLIPISIFGVLSFMYGFFNWGSDTISKEICSDDNTILMCPKCVDCDYWEMKDICFSSKLNFLIENDVTVVFALSLAVWATLYLELWKRYSARLMHRWGLTGFSEEIEHPRPQYLSRINKTPSPTDEKKNIDFDDVPFWGAKCLSDFTSYSLTLLLISVALIAFFSLIVYRMAERISKIFVYPNNGLITRLTTSIIDLAIISLLDNAYSHLGVYLTNLEYRRTQTEYDDSLTVKKYIFQFVNYYTSLFYIVVVKDKFASYPGNYIQIFGIRQEECAPVGCVMDLCMKLAVIMGVKQVVNAILEMTIPYVKKVYNKYRTNFCKKRILNINEKLDPCNQWTQDYYLTPFTQSSLYSEYLEMVLQFGFITMFGLAFPLAPLLALFNNVIEMRLDAFKMLNFLRRPVAQRIRNIGVWYNIMAIVSKIAVSSSAMIIAFSTNLIPKFVYLITTEGHSLEGYLNFTLAHFDTKSIQAKSETTLFENVTTCHYATFIYHKEPYERQLIYWEIFTARLGFIVLFQYIVWIIQTLVAWLIPDVPKGLRKQIKKEEYRVRESIIEYEKKVAAELASKAPNLGDDVTPFLNQFRNSLYTRRCRSKNASDDKNEDQTSWV